MMKEIQEFCPHRVFVPGAVAYELGDGLDGKRALLVASMRLFGDPAYRIVRPSVVFTAHGLQVWSGLERLQRLTQGINEEDMQMTPRQILALFPIWEQWKPHNLRVQLHEVDILPKSLDKEYIPRVLASFPDLVLEWTSKSHPLRVVGLPSVLDLAEKAGLDYTRVTVHRAFRELRSVLKNGLPLEDPEDGPFGDILCTVTVLAVPMRGERTDLIYVTPHGAQRLRFVRQFDGPEDRMKWFLRDATEFERYAAQRPSGRVAEVVPSVRGQCVYSPETLVKLVTVEGVKGMAVRIDHNFEIDGSPIDLIVDIRSVVSKGCQRRLHGEAPFWYWRTRVGATDHGSPMHRVQQVSVRPETALFAGLSDRVDPVEHLEPGLTDELDDLWRMAGELGLTI